MVGFLKRLFGSPKPTGPAPNPLVSDRLNVFAGTLASEMAATDYGMGFSDGATLSEDLGGVDIGPDDIEIIFGAERISASAPMLHFRGPRHPTGEANAYILLSDRGYDVDALTGDTVRFIGMCDVT